jgi:DNA-binding NarL/FixJ family response regulator
MSVLRGLNGHAPGSQGISPEGIQPPPDRATPPITVALVDDYALVREAVRLLLDSQPGITVVATEGDPERALQIVRRLSPQILITEVALPGSGGAALAARVAEDAPRTRVIALTAVSDDRHVARMMEAGARGYVLKRSSPQDLLRAVRIVARGGHYIDPAVAHALGVPLPDSPSRDGVPLDRLTPREIEILRLLAAGKTTTEIAAALGVSPSTVGTHVTNLKRRLGVTTRSGLISVAASGRLTPPSPHPLPLFE